MYFMEQSVYLTRLINNVKKFPAKSAGASFAGGQAVISSTVN